MQKLVIDRQRWLRGEGGGNSCLLRERDEKMCCLGFYCIANNMSHIEITNVTSPGELEVNESSPNFLLELVEVPDMREPFDNEICNLLMNVNDAEVGIPTYANVTSEEDREQQLKRLFEDIGVEVEFIN